MFYYGQKGQANTLYFFSGDINFIEFKGVMQGPDGKLGIFFLNNTGDLDLRGRDHGDVNSQ